MRITGRQTEKKSKRIVEKLEHVEPQTYTYIDSASMSNVEKIRKNRRSGTTNFLRTVCVVILKQKLAMKMNLKNHELHIFK